jgi:cell wall-associated NlpC family hydrolase
MVEWAEKYVGIPYILHGSDINGCDCYGLIKIIYENEFDIKLPDYNNHYTPNTDDDEIIDIYKKEVRKWKQVQTPKIGSVIYFVISGQPKHVGVVIGDREFLHNMSDKTSSNIGDFKSNKWKRRVIGFYDYE